MSEETTNSNCLFSIEVIGEDVSIKIEGSAINLAETIANAAAHSEEVNMVLKAAMMMLIQYEMGQDEDEDQISEERFQTGKEAAVELAQALFPLKMGEA
jgi:hypothetical protein